MYVPDPDHHDSRGEFHAGLYNLLFAMKVLKDCAACGAIYDNGGEEDAIEEACERAKKGVPAFRGLKLKDIPAEVSRIQRHFGGHNGCWS